MSSAEDRTIFCEWHLELGWEGDGIHPRTLFYAYVSFQERKKYISWNYNGIRADRYWERDLKTAKKNTISLLLIFFYFKYKYDLLSNKIYNTNIMACNYSINSDL